MFLALKLWKKRDLFKRDPRSNFRERSQIFLRDLILPSRNHGDGRNSSFQKGVSRNPRFWRTTGTPMVRNPQRVGRHQRLRKARKRLWCWSQGVFPWKIVSGPHCTEGNHSFEKVEGRTKNHR